MFEWKHLVTSKQLLTALTVLQENDENSGIILPPLKVLDPKLLIRTVMGSSHSSTAK